MNQIESPEFAYTFYAHSGWWDRYVGDILYWYTNSKFNIRNEIGIWNN